MYLLDIDVISLPFSDLLKGKILFSLISYLSLSVNAYKVV